MTVGKNSRLAFVKDYEGYRSAARRSNGALVVVYHAENEGGWITLCDNHGLSANHRTRQLAENHAVFPEAWCDECATSGPNECRMVAVTKEWEEGWLEARGVGLV